MKKLLKTLVVFGATFAMTACASGNGGKPLEDKESAAWVLHGQHLLADGTPNQWDKKPNELYEASKMTAISVADAKKIDANVGKALAGKKVKYLYKYEGAILGTNDAGWKTTLKKDGKLYKANGSYCFKAAKVSYEEEDQVYAEQQWMPHDHDMNAENLTPASLWLSPNFAEEPDADGFSWDYNPAVLEAGVYTLIFAQYDAVSDANTYGLGIAAVKTEAREGLAMEEIVEYVPGDHTYGITGKFGSINWDADEAMTRVGTTDVWTKVGLTLAAGDQIKVRADGKWDFSWGFSALVTNPNFKDADGNIEVVTAGTYTVTIGFVAGVGAITIA